MGNALLEVMLAVVRKTGMNQEQQIEDSKSTTIDVSMQQTIYNSWSGRIAFDTASAISWANKLAKDPDNKSFQAHLNAAQARLQGDETQQQTQTQLADSGTNAEQNQTGTDSSNTQQTITLEQAINAVLQALNSVLAQRY